MNLATIVGHMGGRCKGQFDEQDAWNDTPVESTEVKAVINTHIEKLLAFVEKNSDRRDFDEVERSARGAERRSVATRAIVRKTAEPRRSS